jgi:hypothetical protein
MISVYRERRANADELFVQRAGRLLGHILDHRTQYTAFDGNGRPRGVFYTLDAALAALDVE